MMMQQTLLPADNKCLMSAYESNSDDIDVYLGLALIEKVKRRENPFQLKLLIARLYNAGYKRKVRIEPDRIKIELGLRSKVQKG